MKNFKVWNNKTEQWVDSFYIDKEGNIYDHKKWDSNLKSSYTLIDGVVCQSTGLFDRNKKEIFENDLMQHPDGRIFKVNYINWDGAFRAVYSKPNDYSSLPLQINDRGQAIVVGNIFENKDLLGKEG